MIDFLKKNLVWIAIGFCVVGIVLSLVGIPTKQPVCFFIGIVFALPTIAYLIYQVFFDHGKQSLNLHTNGDTKRHQAANHTTILDKRENVILRQTQGDEDTDDDLEPLYNGFATEAEIEQQLSIIAQAERQKAIENTPVALLPNLDDDTVIDEAAIVATTNGELLRQRELEDQKEPTTLQLAFKTEFLPAPEPVTLAITTVSEEDEEETFAKAILAAEEKEMDQAETAMTEPSATTIPTAVLELAEADEPITTDVPATTTDNADLDTSATPVATTAPAPTNQDNPMIRTIDISKSKERQQQRANLKREIFSQSNLEKYLKHYFIETATCFLLDRNIYKDNFGIAPYNKFSLNKENGLPEYSMAATKGKLYKFCTNLPDVERFIIHPKLYPDFVAAIEKGVSLSRISETLHTVYRKKYKKDFILNLTNREDWDNVMILVFNNYILNNDNFKDVFIKIPFEIPLAYNEINVTDYLCDVDIQEHFMERFPTFGEIGLPTVWEALYICFVNSIKNKLPIEELENAILKDYKKIVRTLKRTDNARRKMRKAS